MTLSATHRSQLLGLARQSIDAGLSEQRQAPMPALELHEALAEHRGSFVTLRIGEQLRGCCGNLTANRSVAEDVWRNAWASAFADPRFAPLDRSEWPDVHLHVSVLSPLEPMAIESEAQLLASLRPYVDGVVLERDHSKATFLPDVWEQLPDPTLFIQHLKQKAGWPANSWSPHIKVHRYTTESFGELEMEVTGSHYSRRA